MNLYREVDYQTEPCQVVGVHPLQWNERLREPTMGFVEVELDDIPEVRALRERMAFEKAKTDRFVAEALEITAEQDTELRALRARVAELESHIAATDPWKGEG